MDLVSLVVAVLIFAVAFWAINNHAPVGWRNILNLVLVVIVILWALGVLGVLGPLHNIRIG